MIMFITVTNEFKHKKQKEKGLTITFVKPLVLVREITSYLSLLLITSKDPLYKHVETREE